MLMGQPFEAAPILALGPFLRDTLRGRSSRSGADPRRKDAHGGDSA